MDVFALGWKEAMPYVASIYSVEAGGCVRDHLNSDIRIFVMVCNIFYSSV